MPTNVRRGPVAGALLETKKYRKILARGGQLT